MNEDLNKFLKWLKGFLNVVLIILFLFFLLISIGIYAYISLNR